MTDQTATLLHNMGCRPGVPVLHRAAHACSLVSFGLPAFGSTKQGSMKRGSTRPGILEQWCNLLGVVSTSVDARLEAILTIAQESSTSLERLPAVASVVVAGSSMRVFGLSDDPRLAAPRPRQDENRSLRRLDALKLGGVESRQTYFNASHGRSSQTCRDPSTARARG